MTDYIQFFRAFLFPNLAKESEQIAGKEIENPNDLQKMQ